MTKRKGAAKKVESVLLHFTTTFNSTSSLLESFQKLCRDLEVDVGASRTQCKKNVRKANVNIYDFVRVQQTGDDISSVKFPSNAALRRDMRDNPGRRFPLHRAKENWLVEAMLVNM